MDGGGQKSAAEENVGVGEMPHKPRAREVHLVHGSPWSSLQDSYEVTGSMRVALNKER